MDLARRRPRSPATSGPPPTPPSPTDVPGPRDTPATGGRRDGRAAARGSGRTVTRRAVRAAAVAVALALVAACGGSGESEPADDEAAPADESERPPTTTEPSTATDRRPTTARPAAPTPVAGPGRHPRADRRGRRRHGQRRRLPAARGRGRPVVAVGPGRRAARRAVRVRPRRPPRPDGNSWFYEFDPATNTLTRTAEVAAALGHQPGDWGYGKVHAPMVLGPCDEVIAPPTGAPAPTWWWAARTRATTCCGTTRRRTSSRSLGVPVAGFGIPSLAISPDRRWIFGEAVDPATPDRRRRRGVLRRRRRHGRGDVPRRQPRPHGLPHRPRHRRRRGAVRGAGRVAVRVHPGRRRPAAARRRVARGLDADVEPSGARRRPRTASRSTPTRCSGSRPTARSPRWARSRATPRRWPCPPTASTLYYVPGAHGDAYEAGAPLIAVDTATGEHRTVVEMQDMVASALDLRFGGHLRRGRRPRREAPLHRRQRRAGQPRARTTTRSARSCSSSSTCRERAASAGPAAALAARGAWRSPWPRRSCPCGGGDDGAAP